MPDLKSDPQDASRQREIALSRWENEGGAEAHRTQEAAAFGEMHSTIPPLTNTELVQLRIRVIALENLVIALLAGASDRDLDRVHEMASYIIPRPGATEHPLTIHAAARMIDFVERADHFRAITPS
jgi:hypothetical protein